MKSRILVLFAVVISFAIGCAGARGTLSFRNLKYPVSFSPVVEVDGKTLRKEKMIELGRFSTSKIYWGVLYGSVKISGNYDFSDEINQAIAQHEARGIHSLRITTSQCPTSYAIPLTWIAWLPSCSKVQIEGILFK